MRTIIAILLAFFITMPLLAFGLFGVATVTWALDRDFYIDILDDEAIYEAALQEDLPRYVNNEAIDSADQLPPAALSAGLRTVVTTDYLRDQSVGIVDDFFDYLEGDTDELRLILDMRPIKTDLQDEAAQQAFARAVAENLPTCAAGQEPVAPGGRIQRCIDSDSTVEDATASIANALPGWVENLENEILLNDDGDLDGSGFENDLRGTIDFSGAILGTVLCLLFVAGIPWLVTALVGGSTRRRFFLWLGGTLVLPALFVLGGGLLVGGLGAIDWEFNDDLRYSETYTYSEAFETAIEDTVGDAFTRIGGDYLLAGGIATALGVLLLVIAFVLPPGIDQRPMTGGPTVTIPGPGPTGEKPKRDEF